MLKVEESDEINVKFKNDRRVFCYEASLFLSAEWNYVFASRRRKGERTGVKLVILSNDMNELALFTCFYGDSSRRL